MNIIVCSAKMYFLPYPPPIEMRIWSILLIKSDLKFKILYIIVEVSFYISTCLFLKMLWKTEAPPLVNHVISRSAFEINAFNNILRSKQVEFNTYVHKEIIKIVNVQVLYKMFFTVNKNHSI